jgi:hypothetical protein
MSIFSPDSRAHARPAHPRGARNRRPFLAATAAGGALLLLAGCAAQPDSVQAQYVSPAMYANYDCDQVDLEIQRVSARVAQVTGQQQDAADGDAVATGVGLILFWPALFFLAGSDHSDELGRLKGEYEALERAAIEKDCSFAGDLAERRQRDADARAAREAEERARRNEPAPRF